MTEQRKAYLEAIEREPNCYRCGHAGPKQAMYRGTVKEGSKTICPECMSAWVRGEWSAAA